MANSENSQNDILKQIWKFLSSTKLLMFLLLVLAGASVVGTVIPQKAEPSQYIKAYGEVFYKLFQLLGIFDLYHSWWFYILLAGILINLVVCSINRVPVVWKQYFYPSLKVTENLFKNITNKEEVILEVDTLSAGTKIENILNKRYKVKKQEINESDFSYVARRGDISIWGSMVSHLGILIIFIGVLYGNFYGFKERNVSIIEGEIYHEPHFNFDVKLEDFSIEYDDKGRVKDYKSKLTVFESKKKILTKTIEVNDPLIYKGVKFYQSSYGTYPGLIIYQGKNKKVIGIKEGDLITTDSNHTLFIHRITSETIGQQHSDNAQQSCPLTKLMAQVFFNSDFKNNPENWEKIGWLQEGKLVKFKDYNLILKSIDVTVLEVKKDPGIWIVWTGFIIVTLGMFVAFYITRRQILIYITPHKKDTKIMLAGISQRGEEYIMPELTKIKNELLKGG